MRLVRVNVIYSVNTPAPALRPTCALHVYMYSRWRTTSLNLGRSSERRGVYMYESTSFLKSTPTRLRFPLPYCTCNYSGQGPTSPTISTWKSRKARRCRPEGHRPGAEAPPLPQARFHIRCPHSSSSSWSDPLSPRFGVRNC